MLELNASSKKALRRSRGVSFFEVADFSFARKALANSCKIADLNGREMENS